MFFVSNKGGAYMSKFCLTKYLVEACWYGRRPAGTSPDESDFAGVIGRYFTWVNNLPSISDTLVEGTSVYVREVAGNDDGQYLFSLWMKTSRDASACALKLSARPGERSEVEQHNYSEGFSPGCPMYIYVDVQSMAVYTVKPEKSCVGGKAFFEKAVKSFMLYHPEHEQLLLRNENGVAVASNDVSQNVKMPSFRLKQCVNGPETDNIIAMAPNIRKLVHTVPMVSPETRNVLRAFLGGLWQSFGLSVGQNIEPNVSEMRYEVNVDLTEDELRTMLEHQSSTTASDRLGFKVSVKEGGRIYWADKTVDQQECDLNVRTNHGVCSAASLLSGVKGFLQTQGGER